MKETAYDALFRYDVMMGTIEGVSENVEQQAARDRELYGKTYLCFLPSGEPGWHPVLMIRFLVEVCGISFRDSWFAVLENTRQTVPLPDNLDPPLREAQSIFAAFGNIFEARAYAVLMMEAYADDERGRAHWQSIKNCIENIAFVPLNLGVDWD